MTSEETITWEDGKEPVVSSTSLRIPPVLHGQAEDARLRRSRGALHKKYGMQNGELTRFRRTAACPFGPPRFFVGDAANRKACRSIRRVTQPPPASPTRSPIGGAAARRVRSLEAQQPPAGPAADRPRCHPRPPLGTRGPSHSPGRDPPRAAHIPRCGCRPTGRPDASPNQSTGSTPVSCPTSAREAVPSTQLSAHAATARLTLKAADRGRIVDLDPGTARIHRAAQRQRPALPPHLIRARSGTDPVDRFERLEYESDLRCGVTRQMLFATGGARDHPCGAIRPDISQARTPIDLGDGVPSHLRRPETSTPRPRSRSCPEPTPDRLQPPETPQPGPGRNGIESVRQTSIVRTQDGVGAPPPFPVVALFTGSCPSGTTDVKKRSATGSFERRPHTHSAEVFAPSMPVNHIRPDGAVARVHPSPTSPLTSSQIQDHSPSGRDGSPRRWSRGQGHPARTPGQSTGGGPMPGSRSHKRHQQQSWRVRHPYSCALPVLGPLILTAPSASGKAHPAVSTPRFRARSPPACDAVQEARAVTTRRTPRTRRPRRSRRHLRARRKIAGRRPRTRPGAPTAGRGTCHSRAHGRGDHFIEDARPRPAESPCRHRPAPCDAPSRLPILLSPSSGIVSGECARSGPKPRGGPAASLNSRNDPRGGTTPTDRPRSAVATVADLPDTDRRCAKRAAAPDIPALVATKALGQEMEQVLRACQRHFALNGRASTPNSVSRSASPRLRIKTAARDWRKPTPGGCRPPSAGSAAWPCRRSRDRPFGVARHSTSTLKPFQNVSATPQHIRRAVVDHRPVSRNDPHQIGRFRKLQECLTAALRSV